MFMVHLLQLHDYLKSVQNLNFMFKVSNRLTCEANFHGVTLGWSLLYVKSLTQQKSYSLVKCLGFPLQMSVLSIFNEKCLLLSELTQIFEIFREPCSSTRSLSCAFSHVICSLKCCFDRMRLLTCMLALLCCQLS